jgi:hypothetical protein
MPVSGRAGRKHEQTHVHACLCGTAACMYRPYSCTHPGTHPHTSWVDPLTTTEGGETHSSAHRNPAAGCRVCRVQHTGAQHSCDLPHCPYLAFLRSIPRVHRPPHPGWPAHGSVTVYHTPTTKAGPRSTAGKAPRVNPVQSPSSTCVLHTHTAAGVACTHHADSGMDQWQACCADKAPHSSTAPRPVFGELLQSSLHGALRAVHV